MQSKEKLTNEITEAFKELSESADSLSPTERRLALKGILSILLPTSEDEGFKHLKVVLDHASTILAMSAAYHIIDHDGKSCAEGKIEGAEEYFREMTKIELAAILKKANKPNPFEEKTHNQQVYEEILSEMEEASNDEK